MWVESGLWWALAFAQGLELGNHNVCILHNMVSILFNRGSPQMLGLNLHAYRLQAKLDFRSRCPGTQGPKLGDRKLAPIARALESRVGRAQAQ